MAGCGGFYPITRVDWSFIHQHATLMEILEKGKIEGRIDIIACNVEDSMILNI